MKPYCIQAEKEGGLPSSEVPSLVLSSELWGAHVLMCSRRGSNQGVWGEKGVFWGSKASSWPLRLPSTSCTFTPCAACIPPAPSWRASSPCDVWLFCMVPQQQPRPHPHSAVRPAARWCLVPPSGEALCWAHRLFPFGAREFRFLFMYYFTYAPAFCPWPRCMVCRKGQNKLWLEVALSVCKHSGQTLRTSGFCSKFFSAHVKQLSKRVSCSWKEQIWSQVSRQPENRDKSCFSNETKTTEWENFIFVDLLFSVFVQSFLQRLSSTSTSW